MPLFRVKRNIRATSSRQLCNVLPRVPNGANGVFKVAVPLQLAELLFKGLYVGFADFNCLLPRGVVYSYAVIGKMYVTG